MSTLSWTNNGSEAEHNGINVANLDHFCGGDDWSSRWRRSRTRGCRTGGHAPVKTAVPQPVGVDTSVLQTQVQQLLAEDQALHLALAHAKARLSSQVTVSEASLRAIRSQLARRSQLFRPLATRPPERRRGSGPPLPTRHDQARTRRPVRVAQAARPSENDDSHDD